MKRIAILVLTVSAHGQRPTPQPPDNKHHWMIGTVAKVQYWVETFRDYVYRSTPTGGEEHWEYEIKPSPDEGTIPKRFGGVYTIEEQYGDVESPIALMLRAPVKMTEQQEFFYYRDGNALIVAIGPSGKNKVKTRKFKIKVFTGVE